MSTARIAAALALLAGVLLYSRRAVAAINPAPLPVGLPENESDDWSFVSPEFGVLPMPLNSNPQNRVRAFLYAIRMAEHAERDVTSGGDYFTMFGGERFSGVADHPVITGEKKGVPLKPEWCIAAGFSPGCVSTAAGAYQFRKDTWQEMRSIHPRLPDFSPASQDEAARRLLVKIGAMPAVLAGDWEQAVARSAGRWASLPGSTAKQGGRSLSFVLASIADGLNVG